MPSHEVVNLRPLAPETNRNLAWQALLVEFGSDFAYGDD